MARSPDASLCFVTRFQDCNGTRRLANRVDTDHRLAFCDIIPQSCPRFSSRLEDAPRLHACFWNRVNFARLCSQPALSVAASETQTSADAGKWTDFTESRMLRTLQPMVDSHLRTAVDVWSRHGHRFDGICKSRCRTDVDGSGCAGWKRDVVFDEWPAGMVVVATTDPRSAGGRVDGLVLRVSALHASGPASLDGDTADALIARSRHDTCASSQQFQRPLKIYWSRRFCHNFIPRRS